MEVHEEKMNEVVILAPQGRLDSTTSPTLSERLVNLASVPDGRLILDLGGVAFISSAGLRVILAAAKQANAAGTRMLLCSVQPQVHEVFDISGFTALLEIHDEREVALEELS